jgi:processing peptidase subunit alpha
LGSASAFSSGGPGKGMHSRCTKYLLNRVACVEKASYINEHFEEHGLFGLTVGGPHQTVPKSQLLLRQWMLLSAH